MNSKLESILNSVFHKLGYETAVEVIKSKVDGVDFQCDNLFKLAKSYHKAPFMIGDEIIKEVKKIDNFDDYFKSVECVKPGFINICVSDKFINMTLNEIIEKDRFGISLDNDVIVLDYGGPNVAKPLHVGHLRTAIIGQAINNILTFKGNKVISDVHLGDIGTQMGQVIYGIMEDFPDLSNVSITLDYLNKTYPKISSLCKEDEEVKKRCLKITKELQEQLLKGGGLYIDLWKKIYDISVSDIKRLYDYLGVKFDYWYGESDAFKYYDEMIPYMESKGIVKVDDGAKIIHVSEDDDKINIPPLILQNSGGSPTAELDAIYFRQQEDTP